MIVKTFSRSLFYEYTYKVIEDINVLVIDQNKTQSESNHFEPAIIANSYSLIFIILDSHLFSHLRNLIVFGLDIKSLIAFILKSL